MLLFKPSTKTYFTTNHIIVISTGVDNVAAESRKTVFGDGIQSSNCRNLGVESLQNESEQLIVIVRHRMRMLRII